MIEESRGFLLEHFKYINYLQVNQQDDQAELSAYELWR